MRWRIPKNELMTGHSKRTRFLWFPKCCHGEWRWLEKASWHGKTTWGSFSPRMKTMLNPYWYSKGTTVDRGVPESKLP